MIETNQLNTDNTQGIFNFFGSADYVIMSQITVIYTYDALMHCYDYGYLSNIIINATSKLLVCKNPVMFINNKGQTIIDGIHVDIDIFHQEIIKQKYPDFKYHYFEYQGDIEYPFILNQGVMNISNALITNTIAEDFIYNQYRLSLSNVTILNGYNEDKYDPNDLHSNQILLQSGSESFLYIVDSLFIGSGKGVAVQVGSATILDSSFQNSLFAIVTIASDEFIMKYCKIKNNGHYYGSFMSDYDSNRFRTTGFIIWGGKRVELSYNTFSGFDPRGLLYIAASSSILLENNVINVDISGLYYHVPCEYIHFEYGLLTYYSSTDTNTIDNKFYYPHNMSLPKGSIWYDENYGTNCLSGNVFTNHALYVHKTDITSCFRKGMIQCVINKSVHCQNEIYGQIEPLLFDHEMSIFITGAINKTEIITAVQSNIALDNINITILPTANVSSIFLSGNKSNIMLFDSYITKGHDISFYNESCQLMQNDRLLNDTNYLSSLLLSCKLIKESGVNIMNSMASPVTSFVTHLSPVQLNLSANSSNYYPGKSLTLNHMIMDKIGNNIYSNFTPKLQVNIETKLFSTFLEIFQGGQCPACDGGILINTISIKQDVGSVLILNLSIIDNVLYATNSKISVNITGCPIMYNPSPTNYSCIPCDTDNYNINPFNVENCTSCDPKENSFIKCKDGTITIEPNYWMKITTSGNIISSICPQNTCCQNSDSCDYLSDKDSLCAPGRNYSSTLCSVCNDEYSVSMDNSNCIQCYKQFYFQYLLYAFGISIIWVLGITMTTSDKYREDSFSKVRPTKCRILRRNLHRMQRVLSKQDLILILKTMWNTNIMYYQQSLSQLLSQGSYRLLFSVLLRTFNLSITNISGSNENDGICFIHGLTSKHKILTDLVAPTFVSIIIFVLFLIAKCKKNKVIIIFGKRQISFSKTFITMYLLLISSILAVLFRLLHCQTIGASTYHFYFAYEQCYGATWMMALLSLILIVASFSFIFIKLRKMTIVDRQNPGNGLSSLMTKFKPQYYYWEFVLFMRRIIIAFFAASAFDNNYKLVFIIILSVFLYLQHEYQPFITYQGNKMEFILLRCLIFVVVLDMTSFINSTFEQILIASSIIFEFILFAYLMIRYAFSSKLKTSEKIDINDVSMDYLDACNINERDDKDKMMLDHLIKTERKLSFPLQKMSVSSEYHIIDDHEEEIREESTDTNDTRK